MLPPQIPDDPLTLALRQILPVLGPLFDVFGVPLPKRREVIGRARAELLAKHPDLIHTAELWLLRRILRICTEDEAGIFWGESEVPDELLFQEPPFFRRDPDRR